MAITFIYKFFFIKQANVVNVETIGSRHNYLFRDIQSISCNRINIPM